MIKYICPNEKIEREFDYNGPQYAPDNKSIQFYVYTCKSCKFSYIKKTLDKSKLERTLESSYKLNTLNILNSSKKNIK